MMRTSDSERLFKRLNVLRDMLKNMDDGKIGTAAVPEIIDCSYENRTAVFCFPYPEWMLNYGNVMHGGMVALLADVGMGLFVSAYPEGKQFTPTITLDLTYLSPIPHSDSIIIKSHIQQVTHKILYARCDLYSDQDTEKVLASATGTYYRKIVE